MAMQEQTPPFAIDDVVFHEKFGRGTVVATPKATTGGDGKSDWRVQVQFEGKGPLSVAASFLKLESEVHQVDRIRKAAKAYGELSIATERLLRKTGHDIQEVLGKYLHRQKRLVFGVPPTGQWKPDTDYNDAAFSSYGDSLLSLDPLVMGLAIKIENIDDHGATWIRLRLTLEQRGDQIRLQMGDTPLPTLPVKYSTTDLQDVAASIVDMAIAIFSDGRGAIAKGYFDWRSPMGFLRSSDDKSSN